MEDILLEYQDVMLGYDETPVLTRVDLSVRRGELLVIAGSSGCGKSTLLKAAIGLLPVWEGRVRLFGEDLATVSEGRLAELRARTGMLFQGGALINSLTISENVALPLQHHSGLPPRVQEELVRMKLALVGLEAHRHKTPPQLSGGMRKRAALARALALDPELLLCDEPSAGLDPVTAAGLDDLLLHLRSALGMTLVVVTHELSSIEVIADRLVIVAGGGVVFDGSLEKAKQSQLPPVRDFLQRRPAEAVALGPSLLERARSTESEVRE